MNVIKQRLNDSAAMRWAMLLLIGVTTFATYYINDIFSGMKGIMETQLNMNSEGYGVLLSSVSIFNVIGMIIVGGIILDKLGIRRTGAAFVTIAALGSLFIAIGGSGKFVEGAFGYGLVDWLPTNYAPGVKLMMIGRLLFGLGLETCCVMVQKVIVKWFKGKELALGFAINMALGRFGSAFAIYLGPKLAGDLSGGMYPSFPTSLWFGFALGALALLMFLLYCTFDVKIDKQLESETVRDVNGKSAADREADADVKVRGPFGWLWNTGLVELVTNKAFLYITALCVTFYAAVFPFIGYAQDMLVNKFGFIKQDAATIAALIPIGTILFTPIFGRLVDKKGKSASLMIIGSLLLIFAHLMLSLTSLTPYIALLALGVAFSLVPAAMWPSVAKIVAERRLGLAYSMMFTIQNFGLMLFFYLIGKVLQVTNPGVTQQLIDAKEATYNYTTTILMLAFLGLAGILFALLLKKEDKKAKFGLELPSGVTE